MAENQINSQLTNWILGIVGTILTGLGAFILYNIADRLDENRLAIGSNTTLITKIEHMMLQFAEENEDDREMNKEIIKLGMRVDQLEARDAIPKWVRDDLTRLKSYTDDVEKTVNQMSSDLLQIRMILVKPNPDMPPAYPGSP